MSKKEFPDIGIDKWETREMSLPEIVEKLDELTSRFSVCEDSEEKEKILQECNRLSSLEIARATTYEEILAAHFHSLDPEYRKLSYLKLIEAAPSKEVAQQLVYNALDGETLEAAHKKLGSFEK